MDKLDGLEKLPGAVLLWDRTLELDDSVLETAVDELVGLDECGLSVVEWTELVVLLCVAAEELVMGGVDMLELKVLLLVDEATEVHDELNGVIYEAAVCTELVKVRVDDEVVTGCKLAGGVVLAVVDESVDS